MPGGPWARASVVVATSKSPVAMIFADFDPIDNSPVYECWLRKAPISIR